MTTLNHITRPETHYARTSDGVHVAYQVVGDGRRDLVLIPGFVSHLDLAWEEPRYAAFLERLASFSRLILFDKRGTGLSDRVGGMPTLEQRMDDVRAVMDATGSGSAVLVGLSDGGSMAALLAATEPERVGALVLIAAVPRLTITDGYPWGLHAGLVPSLAEIVRESWGAGATLPLYAPGFADDDDLRDWWGRSERQGASPADAAALLRMTAAIDIRDILPAVRVPTVVLHRRGDQVVSVEAGRFLADRIPGARFVELPGSEHVPFLGDVDSLLAPIEELVTGAPAAAPAPPSDRALATVVFTDIVRSTATVARLGDQQWRRLLGRHDDVARRAIPMHRGRLVKHTGDGLLATFDGPGRGIACARALRDSLSALGIQIRAGVHTGEVEQRGDDIGGIALHVGARVATTSQAGEILVTRTVCDLVAGSDIRFVDRGEHHLRGVDEPWRLYAVAG